MAPAPPTVAEKPVARPPVPEARKVVVATPVAESGLAAALALAQLGPAHWIELFQQLPLTGVARNIAANSVLQDVSGNRLNLLLEDGKATLYNDEHRKRIEAVLSEYFAVPIDLRVDIGAVSAETPADWRQRLEAERQEAARKAFTEDALVRAVVERFGAEIQYDSITPLSSDELH